jgi:hypothetical protein
VFIGAAGPTRARTEGHWEMSRSPYQRTPRGRKIVAAAIVAVAGVYGLVLRVADDPPSSPPPPGGYFGLRPVGSYARLLARLQPHLHPGKARPQQFQQLSAFPPTQPSAYPGGSSRIRFRCLHTRIIARRLPYAKTYCLLSSRSDPEWLPWGVSMATCTPSIRPTGAPEARPRGRWEPGT